MAPFFEESGLNSMAVVRIPGHRHRWPVGGKSCGATPPPASRPPALAHPARSDGNSRAHQSTFPPRGTTYSARLRARVATLTNSSSKLTTLIGKLTTLAAKLPKLTQKLSALIGELTTFDSALPKSERQLTAFPRKLSRTGRSGEYAPNQIRHAVRI